MMNNSWRELGYRILFFTWILTLSGIALSKEQPKELSVATYDFPPYNYLENGKLMGASTELLQHIFKEMGYTLNIASLPFKRAQKLVEKGEVAMIFTYTHSEQRRKTAYLSNPISYISGVFFKRKQDNISWREYKDLAALRIGASGGYFYPEPFFKAIKDNHIKANFVYRNNPDLVNLRMLNMKRTDVFICELNVCGFLMNKYQPEFEGLDYINKRTGSIRSFHVGFSKMRLEGEGLRNKFNDALDSSLAAGQLQTIFKKYDIIVDFNLLGSKDWQNR